MAKQYKIERGGLHDRFQNSHAKVQIFGGGFGNGKTTAAVIKALRLAKDYPGSNGLVARSTYPKLNSTTRKALIEWCPASWIKRNVNSKENLLELTNGSIINFSHLEQGGKQQESSTSNLLSATYDWIVVDQVEDPEITHKDFLDLLGRLRGSTTYQGEDETMPSTGPRWMILCCNPTRNWVYRELVKPLHDYEHGLNNPALLWDLNENKPMIELFEGSTYENAANLPEDFIATQEAAYKGQMRERFLLGKWGAYEGLVYPQYDSSVHFIKHEDMLDYFRKLLLNGVDNNVLEAYDHGIAQPACYGFAFTDPDGNVFILDGFYEKEKTIAQLSAKIKEIRLTYGAQFDEEIEGVLEQGVLADPAVFRRVSGNAKTVGVPTSGLFREEGIKMVRANNDINSGIAKVQSYLAVDMFRRHPIEQTMGSPRLFVSTKLDFFDKEIVDYYWKKNTSGEYEDIPTDRNDHAMDMVKYLLTNRPRIVNFNLKKPAVPPAYLRWREAPAGSRVDTRAHRYGSR